MTTTFSFIHDIDNGSQMLLTMKSGLEWCAAHCNQLASHVGIRPLLNAFEKENALMRSLPSLPSLVVLSLASLTVIAMSTSQAAYASERHFGYVLESTVLAPGEKELELWSTYRRGREAFYSRMDNRLELELGVTDQLMTAFYLNYSSKTQDDGAGGLVTEAGVEGGSIELKYKLSDSVADAFGSALYGEVGLGSEEGSVELKLIVDKRIDRLLVAFNAVYEVEAKFAADETEYEHIVEADFGATYFFRPHFSLGLEARTHHVMVENVDTRGALYVGPVLSYQHESFWIALTTQWQVASLDGETSGQRLELNEHERFNGRLLIGTHF